MAMPFRTGNAYTNSSLSAVIDNNPSAADVDVYIEWLEVELTVAKAYREAIAPKPPEPAQPPQPLPVKSRRRRKKHSDAAESADGQG